MFHVGDWAKWTGPWGTLIHAKHNAQGALVRGPR